MGLPADINLNAGEASKYEFANSTLLRLVVPAFAQTSGGTGTIEYSLDNSAWTNLLVGLDLSYPQTLPLVSEWIAVPAGMKTDAFVRFTGANDTPFPAVLQVL